jgi:hypothetical protein
MVFFYQQELKETKKVRFRAKLSQSGRKILLIVPTVYHKDIDDYKLLHKVVQVEISEISYPTE